MVDDDGALQLKALGVRLKALGGMNATWAAADLTDLGAGKTLRSQLLAGLRTAAKPAVEKARTAARGNLPKKGGLNDYVADTQIGVYNRLAGPRVGVRIGVPKGTKQARKAWGANSGTVRHPVFGHSDRWADTTVKPGWFDETLKEWAPTTAPAIQAVLARVAEEVTSRI